MHKLPAPFFVLATQNPLEQEGTYPLPEAQLDRFLLYIKVDYPTPAEEWEIARRGHDRRAWARRRPACRASKIIEMQQLVTRVPVSDQVLGYAWALVRADASQTRPEAPEFVNKWISWGAGPRGVLTLVTCAKAPRDSLRPVPCHRGGRKGGRETGPAPPHRRQTTPAQAKQPGQREN